MIISPVNKFGQLFPEAATGIEMVVIKREGDISKSGYIVNVLTRTWASIDAYKANAEPIMEKKYIFTDTHETEGSDKFLPIEPLIAEDMTGLQITDDIESIFLTLPHFAGGKSI